MCLGLELLVAGLKAKMDPMCYDDHHNFLFGVHTFLAGTLVLWI